MYERPKKPQYCTTPCLPWQHCVLLIFQTFVPQRLIFHPKFVSHLKLWKSNIFSHYNVLCSKNSSNMHLSNWHLKVVLYNVLYLLQQSFKLWYKQQLGMSLNYKIRLMGNTMHLEHEGGMLLPKLHYNIFFAPWKTNTPSTSKLMNLKTMTNSKSPPNCTHLATIIFVKFVYNTII